MQLTEHLLCVAERGIICDSSQDYFVTHVFWRDGTGWLVRRTAVLKVPGSIPGWGIYLLKYRYRVLGFSVLNLCVV